MEQEKCADCKHSDKPCKPCVGFEPKEKEVELRHGDYGFWIGTGAKAPYIHFKDEVDGKIKPCGKMYYKTMISKPNKYKILGNIFDDLQAEAEPLEEFEVKSSSTDNLVKFNFDVNNTICMQVTYDRMYYNFAPEQIEEIGRNLIRMARTPNKK